MYTPFARRVSPSGHWTCVMLFFIHVPSAGRLYGSMISDPTPFHDQTFFGDNIAVNQQSMWPEAWREFAMADIEEMMPVHKNERRISRKMTAVGKTGIDRLEMAIMWAATHLQLRRRESRRTRGTDEEADERTDAAVEESMEASTISGTWLSTRTEGFDHFLERAMGLGWVKRSLAVRMSQMSTQRQSIRRDGDVTYLTLNDPRGTMQYEVVTDGQPRPRSGFNKLPVQQIARWDDDGTLIVEERYEQHLGGDKHGRPCADDERCPVVRTRRFVDAFSGELVIELERSIEETGETLRMRSFFRRTAVDA